MNNQKQPDPVPVVNPGPSQEVWGEALKKSGIDPKNVAEYNIKDDDKPLDPQ